ncbi:hypothetical protein EUX98_g5221 [Antrodiella citrinella]|uniref:6-phosphofructo-2-kinase domain-containing protein n=1 Tax=Antrodiella citrinella TaxID=2447956 RepID=A0A4S4MS89_9APHY|nr:hypothetical protein EUX98_g5221 [Antrodiella citrinella]
MVAPLYTTASGLLFHAGKILIITVGLPARGKTHISRALERYLRWTGVKTQVVSLGDYRRKTLGGAQKLPPDYFTLGEKSPETVALRQKVSDGCEQLIWDFFNAGGQVVIYDANNGTRERRQKIAEKFDKAGIHIVILESSCDNEELIMSNIRSVKISSPDYRTWDPEKAVADYYRRIKDHEIHYEPVEETTWPFVRVINVGEKIMVNSGHSLIEHSYKADSDLSAPGWDYAERLRDFVLDRRAKSLKARGMEAEDRRLVTKDGPRVKVVEKPQMAEINPGVWDGMTPDQVRKYYPDEWERFVNDPYAYRAPRAESYHDLCELERETEDLLIIGHASVIRCMLAYLIGLPASEIPAIEVARGDLIEVVPTSYGVHSQAYHFWDGPGRSNGGSGKDEHNFYENYAEDTQGKRRPEVEEAA